MEDQEIQEPVRIDKWLWAVRIYKTRNLASTACRNGQVWIDGQRIKPSRAIVTGDLISIKKDHMTMQVRVIAILDNRVGAKLVPGFMEDLTPEEELERARRAQEEFRLNRVLKQGEGRPTKRKRRDLEGFLEQVRQAHDLERE